MPSRPTFTRLARGRFNLAPAAIVSAIACASFVSAAPTQVELPGGIDAIAVASATRIIESKTSTPEQIADAFALRAGAYSEMGDLDKSLNDINAALESKGLAKEHLPLDLDIRASVYARKNEFEKAIADYTRELELRTDGKEIPLTGRADCYSRSDKIDKALADYDSIIALPEASPEIVAMATRGHADCDVRLGQFDKAITEYNKAMALDPRLKPSVLVSRGDLYRATNDNDRAIADFTRALELKTDIDAYTRVERAWVYRNKGETDKAIADDTRVIESADAPAENVASALISRASIRLDARDYDKTLADIEKAIAMKDLSGDNQGAALTCRGNCHRRMGQMDKAIADFTAVMEVKDLSPTMIAEAQFTRGMCYESTGYKSRADVEYAGAGALCAKLIDSPDTVPDTLSDALVDRGFAEYLAGSYEKALEDTRRNLAMYPTSAASLYNIGTILVRQGKYADARKSYEAAMKLGWPLGAGGAETDLIDLRDILHGPPETGVFLGWFHLSAGRPEAATAEFKRYLSDHPDGPLAGWAKELSDTKSEK